MQYEDPVVVEPLTGTDALTMSARRLREAFPDMRLERTAPRIAQGRFGCLPWRLLGTHRGELGGLPASGRFVIVHGIHYIEVSDGLIRRARGFFDLYGAATQLGLLPERGGLAETALLLLRGFGLRARG